MKRTGVRLCWSLLAFALGCHSGEPFDLGPGGAFASHDPEINDGATADAGSRAPEMLKLPRSVPLSESLPPLLRWRPSLPPVSESSPPLGTDAGRGQSLGTACESASDCADGFCVDGVCCESACDGECQECAPNGLCEGVPARDPTCSELICPDGTTCRSHVPSPSLAGNCAALGRCAGLEDCAVIDAPRGTGCGDGRSCDGWGNCMPNEPALDIGPAAECVVQAGFDGDVVDCVNPATQHLLARGSGQTVAFEYLQVEVSEWILELGMFGFDANNDDIESCTLIESAPGTYVTPRGACDGAVRWVLYSNE